MAPLTLTGATIQIQEVSGMMSPMAQNRENKVSAKMRKVPGLCGNKSASNAKIKEAIPRYK